MSLNLSSEDQTGQARGSRPFSIYLLRDHSLDDLEPTSCKGLELSIWKPWQLMLKTKEGFISRLLGWLFRLFTDVEGFPTIVKSLQSVEAIGDIGFFELCWGFAFCKVIKTVTGVL